MGPTSPMTSVPVKGRETFREKTLCDNEGRDCSDAATSQGKPRVSRNWKKQGRVKETERSMALPPP